MEFNQVSNSTDHTETVPIGPDHTENATDAKIEIYDAVWDAASAVIYRIESCDDDGFEHMQSSRALRLRQMQI